MENSRKFTAFISYRHCPLDSQVAEALHRLIERYHVPRDLRVAGKKNLGLVFRDRDELPLSNNLTEDIYTALDQADFLIVVCTPETPKSLWVEREIQYFMERHGRERILTVLAAGTPEESIPKCITHIYDTDGQTVLQRIEPLCAYLVDSDEKKILKNLKKEFLRLVAALLGCHYDALVQRQKRYKAQQITVGAVIIAAVALLFLGMLFNRNRQIQEKNRQIQEKNDQIAQQLLQTQINETKALTLLSKQQLANGDRLAALESALLALPHDGDGRPYSAAAEGALADALNIYSPMKLDYHLTVTQDEDVFSMALSENGDYLLTLDISGNLRCFDTRSAAMLWESSEMIGTWSSTPIYESPWNAFTGADFFICLEVIDSLDLVLCSDELCTYGFSLKTGQLLHTVSFFSERMDSGSSVWNRLALSPDGHYFIQYSQPQRKDTNAEPDENFDPTDEIHFFEVYDTKTFQRVYFFTCNWSENWEVCDPAFSLDGSRLAIGLSNYRIDLLILDTGSWEVLDQRSVETAEETFAFDTHFVWLPENELLISYQQRDGLENINTYFEKLCKDGSSVSAGPVFSDLSYAYSVSPTAFLADDLIFYNLGNEFVYAIDRTTLKRVMGRTAGLAGSYLREDGSLMMIERDGRIAYSTGANKTYAGYLYQHDTDIRIAEGISGEREVLCLVPGNAPYQIIIVTEPQLQKPTPVVSPPKEEYGSTASSPSTLDFMVSPSGRELFAFDLVDWEAQILAVTVYDISTLEITDWFTIQGTEYLNLSLGDFSGFSADETKLFFEGLVYDRLTGALSHQENGEEISGEYHSLVDYPPFSTQKAGSPLLSMDVDNDQLCWWTDGADLQHEPIPYGMKTHCNNAKYSNFTSIGHSGLVVLPLFTESDAHRTTAFGIFSLRERKWHRVENPSDRLGFPIFAIGSTKQQVVFADTDHALRVYDYDLDRVIRQLPLPVYPDSIWDMQLIGQDRYLLITTDTYLVYLIDLETGTELGSYPCDSGLVPFVQGEHLYLKNIGNSLRVHLESGDVVGNFSNLFCPLTVSGRESVLYLGPGNQLEYMPVYTWEELSRMGWALLAQNKGQ